MRPSSTGPDAGTRVPPAAPTPRTSRLFGLPLRPAERRLVLFLGDVLVLFGAGIAALAIWAWLRPDIGLNLEFIGGQWAWLLGLSAAWLVLCGVAGAYNLRVAANPRLISRRLLLAALVFVVMYLALFFVVSVPPALLQSHALGSRQLLRLVPIVFAALAVVADLVWRSFYALVLTREYFQRRVIVVGAGWAGRTIAQAIHEGGEGTYEIVGFVDDSPKKLGIVSDDTGHGHPVLGDRYALKDLISQHEVNTLILAVTHQVQGELLAALLDCLELGVEIVPMPILYEQLTGRVPVEHVGDNWYVAMPIEHPGAGSLYPLIKRLEDVVLASVGLLCLGLALPIIAIAIRLDSPGPVFYTQERVGKGGRLFRAYKFRSMGLDAERGQAAWAAENDPRVTRVGRILRKAHVDEFPQFLNILRGEMSAVGPRPERPEFVQELAEEIPFYRIRHAAKPGMAGWALTKQGYAASKEDALVKLQYDLYYVKHQSLLLDALILARTVVDALTLGGR
jgi:exopolysaccharide biosynthesis polyprenyl glycosylphosphotransferase